MITPCFRFAVASAFILSLACATATTAAPTKDHCIIHLEPAQNGRESRATPRACFETLAESVMAATGNRVQLPPHATVADVDQALQAEDAEPAPDTGTAATYVLSIEYASTYQSGSSRTFTGDRPCSSSLGYNMGSMPSGWNDIISSSRGYSGCNTVIHYEHINHGGASRSCTPTCNTMGVMDNETSALRWRHY